MAVAVGRNSRFLLTDRPRKPPSVPICVRTPATARVIGAQTSVSSLVCSVRVIWKPQRCSPSPRDGYRRLLKGIAISAVHPSRTMAPPVSKSASQE